MEVINMRDKVENKQSYMKKKQESIYSPSPPQTATSSPPSASASPTHEFSFTISLHPQPPPKSQKDAYRSGSYDDSVDDNHRTTRTPPPEPSTAIDLSPADDIFFHGHLLPLHLLSHLPVSPRSSTNSIDSFTLPMKDISKDQHNPIGNTSFHYHHRNTFSDFNLQPSNNVNQTRPKSKSFSLFGRAKGKKDYNQDQDKDKDKERNENNSKKKLKLEVAQLIKRYMKMVKPLLSFSKGRRSNTECNRQAHSFSGTLLSSRSSLPLQVNRGGGKRGEFSAPASMRTSPANSGILLASGTVSPAKSTTSDSTMEELQAAIQAAIAHCKNSIAMEDKVKA